MIHPGIDHMSLAVLIDTKKDDGAGKRAQKSRGDTTIEASSHSFLPEYLRIG